MKRDSVAMVLTVVGVAATTCGAFLLGFVIAGLILASAFGLLVLGVLSTWLGVLSGTYE